MTDTLDSTVDTTIGTRTARAAVWSLLAITGTRLISLASLMILARLLAPRDFGLLAFALVYITYVETIGDLGSGLALIYWPDRRDDAAQVTFWINVGSGVFWFALTLALAPLVADFFDAPDGAGIVRLLALSFPIKYFGNTHDALAQKDLRFRARLVPELALAAAKAIFTISLAFAGLGAWSLAAGQLAGLTCWTVLLWMVVPWRPALRFPRDLLRPMLGYGRGMMTVNILAAVVHHADLAIVGRMLGPTVLGIYQIASRVPEMSVTVLIWVAGKILFPAFAAVHAAGDDLKNAYLAAIRYMSLITLPVAIGLAVMAEPVVLSFFGEKWRSAIPILRALAIYAGVRSLTSPGGDLLKATGRSGLLAKLSVLKAIILVPALIAAATRNAATVAISLAAVSGITMMVNLGVASSLLKLKATEVGRAVLPSFLGALLMGSSLLFLERFLRMPPALELILLAVVGASIYAGSITLMDPNALHEARKRLWRRRAVTRGFARAGRFLIPSSDRTARQYFLRNLYVTHRARDRWIQAIAPGLLLRGRDAGTELEDAISSETADLLREITGFERLRPIVVEDHLSGRSRMLLFLFGPNGSSPAAVAKLRPWTASGATLQSEFRALEFITELPGEIRSTAPRPLAYRRSAGLEVLLLSHLPGRSSYLDMHGFSPQRHIGRHFAAAADWLARLHRVTRLGSQAIVHGDFWARNVLIGDDGQVSGVVDWEHFSRSGSPFQDLFHFPLTYGQSYRWGTDPLDAFRKTFIDATPVSLAVRHYLERYCGAAGVRFAECRDWFEVYLLARGGDGKLPWREFQKLLHSASRSVFSG